MLPNGRPSNVAPRSKNSFAFSEDTPPAGMTAIPGKNAHNEEKDAISKEEAGKSLIISVPANLLMGVKSQKRKFGDPKMGITK